jgi:hypothetical protein
MKRSTFAGYLSAGLCLGLTAPAFAADATTPIANADSSVVEKPGQTCLKALNAFRRTMAADGYWMGGSDYAFGYPMIGYGYGGAMGYPDEGNFVPPARADKTPPPASSATTSPTKTEDASSGPAKVPAVAGSADDPAATTGYWRGRSGYEIRSLIASANILARHGQESSCESVLGATQDLYKSYVAEMQKIGMPKADEPGWRQRQIATAQPVIGSAMSFRSDQLVGTEVRNLQGISLGSVDDIVMSPKTGAITYLVIGRGGLFGINKMGNPPALPG